MSELRRMQQLLAVQTMDTLTNSAHACRCAFADCLTAAPHHQASQPGVHSVQSGCIRPRDVCLGSLNSIGLSLLRSGRSLPRSCMFLAQVGEGMPGSEQNLALRLPRDEVLLIGPLPVLPPVRQLVLMRLKKSAQCFGHANCFLGALPPVDFLAVCLVLAII